MYQPIPYRVASVLIGIDRDIICPCDCAPPQVVGCGACYCNLFINLNFYQNGKAYFEG
ncbi:MAG: hypothetical protein ACFFG0_09920 [Candidatus Thorarchaeota archaeon]